MGKIALWVVVAVVVMLLVRAFKPRRSEGGTDGGPGRAAAGKGADAGRREGEDGRRGGELVMACAVCGVHLPASEAVFAHGRVYCSPGHRDTDLGADPPRRRDAAASEERE